MDCEFHIFFTVSLQKEHLSLSSPFEMKVSIRQGVNVLAFIGPSVRLASNQIFLFLIHYIHMLSSFIWAFFFLFFSFKRTSDISSACCTKQHGDTVSAFSQRAKYYTQNYNTDYSQHNTALEIHECTHNLLHFLLTQITVVLLSKDLKIDFEIQIMIQQ